MSGSRPTIDSMRREVDSDNQEVRGRAMQGLYLLARKEPRARSTALPIFREFLTRAPDGWTATNAARGIEVAAGPEEGRAAWATLLASPFASVASAAALLTKDASFASELFALLQRPETSVRAATIRALGRIRSTDPYARIVAFLDDPPLRADVVQALGELGDPRALGVLERCMRDDTPSGVLDDRGYDLRMSELARDAIEMIHRVKVP